MHHTNTSFEPDPDRVSVGHHSLSLTPVDVRRISTQSTSPKSPRSITDKKNDNDSLSERKVPNVGDISYYSIERLREGRRGKRDDNSTLSRRVRQFYEDQDELIADYERLHNGTQGDENEANTIEKEKYRKTQRNSNILTKVSLGVNIVCRIYFSLFIQRLISILFSSVYSF